MIGEDPVDEFAEGVAVEEPLPHGPELLGREQPGVDQRFLDHREREAGGVQQSVPDGDREQNRPTVPPVSTVDLLRFDERVASVRPAEERAQRGQDSSDHSSTPTV
jgi:hypothetical protein